MAEWKKTKTLMQAEKRLRYATWEGHEEAVPAYRLDVPPMNGHAEDGAQPEYVEDIVKDVESSLSVKIRGHKDATMVQKGGLEKEEEQRRGSTTQDGAVGSDKEMSGMSSPQPPVVASTSGVSDAQNGFGQQPGLNNAGSTVEAVQPSIPPMEPRPTVQTGDHGQMVAQDASDLGIHEGGDMQQRQGIDDMQGMDMGDTSLMEDVGMDVDGGMEFIDHSPAVPDDDDLAPGGAPDMGVQPQEHAATGLDDVDVGESGSPGMFGEIAEPPQPVQDLPQEQVEVSAGAGDAIPTTTTDAVSTAQPDMSAVAEAQASVDEGTGADPAGGSGLFDDGTFDDLTNMGGDDNGDDGLIDFDGGIGMEDSAFGDALHGMDMPGDDHGEAEGEATQGGS